jgi:hypothetical protein
MPRAQQSRRARRDDCIARTMRKSDRTKVPAVAALLLSSDLRLLVRHARASDGWLLLTGGAIVRHAPGVWRGPRKGSLWRATASSQSRSKPPLLGSWRSRSPSPTVTIVRAEVAAGGVAGPTRPPHARELSRVASRPSTAACVRRPRSTMAAAYGGEATLLVNARRARSDNSVGPASESPGGCSGLARVSAPMLLAQGGSIGRCRQP